MEKTIELKEAFDTWAEYSHKSTDHISSENLYNLSLDNGVEKAYSGDLHHLSTCPDCLEDWENMAKESEQTIVTDMAVGFLEAASSEESGSVYMKSSCSNFMLGILPEIDNKDQAMVVFEIAVDNFLPYEGRLVTVKDASGENVIKSTIRQGRAASFADNIKEYDFSTWNVVLSEPAGDK